MNEIDPIEWEDICDEEHSHKTREDYNNVD